MAIGEQNDVSEQNPSRPAAGLAPRSTPGNMPSLSAAYLPIDLSLVVPLYNESENVLPLARRVFEVFANDRRSLELILVDDGSTDATWQQMLSARQLDARVRALRHLKRSGQSAALWTGWSASRGAVIGTLDGDLQNDPSDFTGMLALLTDCDLVCGVRTKRQDNALRRVSTGVARSARRIVLGVDFKDTGCNLRVFKRTLLPKLIPFDGLHRFLPVLAYHAGAVVRELPVTHKARAAGVSKYGLWNRLGRGILDLAAMAWYRHRQIATVQAVEYQNDKPHAVTAGGGKT